MRRLVAVTATALVLFGGTAVAQAYPAPVECPHSNAHVWDEDQCDRLAPKDSQGGGGGCGGGLGCVVGGLLGSVGL